MVNRRKWKLPGDTAEVSFCIINFNGRTEEKVNGCMIKNKEGCRQNSNAFSYLNRGWDASACTGITTINSTVVYCFYAIQWLMKNRLPEFSRYCFDNTQYHFGESYFTAKLNTFCSSIPLHLGEFFLWLRELHNFLCCFYWQQKVILHVIQKNQPKK